MQLNFKGDSMKYIGVTNHEILEEAKGLYKYNKLFKETYDELKKMNSGHFKNLNQFNEFRMRSMLNKALYCKEKGYKDVLFKDKNDVFLKMAQDFYKASPKFKEWYEKEKMILDKTISNENNFNKYCTQELLLNELYADSFKGDSQ
jgi:hypothetical protein